VEKWYSGKCIARRIDRAWCWLVVRLDDVLGGFWLVEKFICATAFVRYELLPGIREFGLYEGRRFRIWWVHPQYTFTPGETADPYAALSPSSPSSDTSDLHWEDCTYTSASESESESASIVV